MYMTDYTIIHVSKYILFLIVRYAFINTLIYKYIICNEYLFEYSLMCCYLLIDSYIYLLDVQLHKYI